MRVLVLSKFVDIVQLLFAVMVPLHSNSLFEPVPFRLEHAGPPSPDRAASKFDVAKSAYRHWMGSFEHDQSAQHLPSGVSMEVAPAYISLVTTSELLLATCMFLGGHRIDATTLFKVFCLACF